MVTHASVPQGYTHVTANTGLARAALPRERWGGRVARGARSRRGGGLAARGAARGRVSDSAAHNDWTGSSTVGRRRWWGAPGCVINPVLGLVLYEF